MATHSSRSAPLEHLADPLVRAALVIQSSMVAEFRRRLTEGGFQELFPPLIGPVTDPGIRGSKQVDIDYYGHPFKLMTSAIFYKQAALTSFERIFFVAPNVRLEPIETDSTGRHLVEFHQLDVEIAGADREEAMQVLETLVRGAVSNVVREHAELLRLLGRQPEVLEAVNDAFDLRTHSEALRSVRELGIDHPESVEITWPAEETLSQTLERPLFVSDYPKGSRGFYDRESRDQPGTLRNFDLLLPGGFGEVSSGGERENEAHRILQRMRDSGENPDDYGWYVEAAFDGLPPSAGFGLGIERLTRFITGLESVRYCHAFPKRPGVVSP